MSKYFRAIGQLPRPQKLVVMVLVLAILLTWLAFCLIVTGVLAA